jgi:hypothetical protein
MEVHPANTPPSPPPPRLSPVFQRRRRYRTARWCRAWSKPAVPLTSKPTMPTTTLPCRLLMPPLWLLPLRQMHRLLSERMAASRTRVFRRPATMAVVPITNSPTPQPLAATGSNGRRRRRQRFSEEGLATFWVLRIRCLRWGVGIVDLRALGDQVQRPALVSETALY